MVNWMDLHQAALAWGVRKGVSLVQKNDDVLELKLVKVTK